MHNTGTGISVIMPVHNGGCYLRQAVDSILNQEQVSFELIIVNDHSTDGALEQLPPHPALTIINAPDRGIVTALNRGLQAANYPYIARMDADDVAHPRRLYYQLSFLQDNPQTDICGCLVRMFNDQGAIAGGYRAYEGWINALYHHDEIETGFFIESPIPHPSAMFHHSLIDELGGYHDTAWPEDYDLWCRALLAGKRFGKPPQPDLLLWRDHSSRLSRADQRYHKQQFLRCKAHYLTRYLGQRDVENAVIWGAGPTGLKLHDYLQAEGFAVDSFIDINPALRDRLKRNKPVTVIDLKSNKQDLASIDSMILVAVSARGARAELKDYFSRQSLREREDYLFAA